MTIPAAKLINLLYLVKNPIILLLHLTLNNENTSNGAPNPRPKNKNPNMLVAKLSNSKARAKNTATKAGLHGITIAPKKKPNKRALHKGFFFTGELNRGKNLPKLILKIKTKLTKPNIAKAIGETSPMTLVNEACNNVVNINPKPNIKVKTPATTRTPKSAKPLLLLSFFSFLSPITSPFPREN